MRVLLRPGLGLKRWLVLLAISTILFSLGVGFSMAISISPKVLPVLRTLTLGDFHPMVRGAVFIVAGVALGGTAVFHTYQWVASGASQRAAPSRPSVVKTVPYGSRSLMATTKLRWLFRFPPPPGKNPAMQRIVVKGAR